MKIPCTLEKFQEWLSVKRAIGLSTLKSKIEDMLRAGKASIIGNTKGGETEELITLYYNNDVLSQDTILLTNMHDRIIKMEHKHSSETVEQYKLLIGQRKRHVMSVKYDTTHTTMKKEDHIILLK
ncbi:hypothetical protein RND71_015630 [Anisodus tanguticus]|uniref:Uncharacterized protein n=1 Tax=Anisodus tanguticus TaxID=243964 RepID=A0AAE1S6V7_9SOLA|nr:hypothetical protein RND71_015630 [Anisodus tanguticus]